MLILNKKYLLLCVVLASSMLTACGGESSKKVSMTNDTQQPHAIEKRQVKRKHKLSRKEVSELTLTTTGNAIVITYTGNNIANAENFQFFIHADNDTSAGIQNAFQWDKLGAEYLIENGNLYKSNSNNTTWDWRLISSDLPYSATSTTISITINKSLLASPLSSTLYVGFLARDSSWNIESYYPGTGTIASFAIDNGTQDTVAPTMTLYGLEAMLVPQNTSEKAFVFTDPGVIAIDDMDGDISTNVTTSSNVDVNTVGTYKITYTATDSAGNTTSITRAVTVVDPELADSVTIDGNPEDWRFIRYMLTNVPNIQDPTLKVFDSSRYLTFLIQKEDMNKNTQIFIDSDNDASTGVPLFGGNWGTAGIDYMIENHTLYQANSSTAWSWIPSTLPINYVKRDKVIEVAIPKSALQNLGETINIGFVNRDSNWNIIGDTVPANGLAGYRITSPEVLQIPAEVRTALCSDPTNPNQLREADFSSLENGVTFKGTRYFTETGPDHGGHPTFILKAEDSSGNIEVISTFYRNKPLLTAIAGAVYISGTITPSITVRPPNRKVYRISNNNLIHIGELNKKWHSLLDPVFKKNQSNEEGTDYYRTYSRYGKNTDFYSKSLSHGERVEKLLYRDQGSSLKQHAEHLLSYYLNGKYYYAFTVGQLRTNVAPYWTHIGERVIRVIDITGAATAKLGIESCHQ